MLKRWTCLVILFHYLISDYEVVSLTSCSEPVDKLQICKLNPDYDQSFPAKPWPMIVNNSVRVLDIVEFNADENTMTIFVQLMAWWIDPDLSLKSNDPNE